MTALTLAGTLLDDIGRDEARRAAVQELIKPQYQQESLFERVVRLIGEFIDGLVDRAPGGVPGGVLALAVVIVVLVALAILLAVHARRATRSRRAAAESMFGAGQRTAAEHRALAERLAAESRWPEAIRERLRAIARDLEDRAVVAPHPGRTAAELAGAAGRELPAFGPRLVAAARLFDDVTYGQAPGSAESYRTMADLDEALRAAKPAMAMAGTGSPATGASPAWDPPTPAAGEQPRGERLPEDTDSSTTSASSPWGLPTPAGEAGEPRSGSTGTPSVDDPPAGSPPPPSEGDAGSGSAGSEGRS
ncbi:DUF4129 domain-containing protein [Sphaerisporangium sp. TRM90804]|uniref:DUF4129 domain-containing protein n=1 Tax=Sphaerisporangium sp. TRM90804 TaxID=3031113 RepID=UPI00244B67EB|nr:DUF4129 domain-containing protein [Sphaerisporangium sp. TRM90804]MDH2427853.1 DUF4129 domain-containing protein [Sphaerisporangium sp. TRM90804]